MLNASFRAGAAFTRAYVGYVHAIAHKMGAMYGIHHGLACAIILPHVLDRYGFTDHQALAELADCAGVSEPWMSLDEKAVAFIRSIRALNAQLGIPPGFRCVTEDADVPKIAAAAAKEANPLYPVPLILDVKDLENLVNSMRLK